MAETIPSAHLHVVQNSEHDFDRDPKDEKAIEAYVALLSWMKESLLPASPN